MQVNGKSGDVYRILNFACTLRDFFSTRDSQPRLVSRLNLIGHRGSERYLLVSANRFPSSLVASIALRA